MWVFCVAAQEGVGRYKCWNTSSIYPSVRCLLKKPLPAKLAVKTIYLESLYFFAESAMYIF